MRLMMQSIVAVTLLLLVPTTLFYSDQLYRLIGSFDAVLAVHLGASLLGCAMTVLIALTQLPRLSRFSRLWLAGVSAALGAVMAFQFVWGLLDPGSNIGLGLLTLVVVLSHPVLAFALVIVAAAYGRNTPARVVSRAS